MTGNHTMAGSPNEKTRFRSIDKNAAFGDARGHPLKPSDASTAKTAAGDNGYLADRNVWSR